MRPVRKPRHWWKGMPSDVPGRGRKAFASLFSTLRVKTLRRPSSGLPCEFERQTLVKIFFNKFRVQRVILVRLFPCFSLLLFLTCLYPLIIVFFNNLSFSVDNRERLTNEQFVGLQISILVILHQFFKSKIFETVNRLYSIRCIWAENIDTNKRLLWEVDTTYESRRRRS